MCSYLIVFTKTNDPQFILSNGRYSAAIICLQMVTVIMEYPLAERTPRSTASSEPNQRS